MITLSETDIDNVIIGLDKCLSSTEHNVRSTASDAMGVIGQLRHTIKQLRSREVTDLQRLRNIALGLAPAHQAAILEIDIAAREIERLRKEAEAMPALREEIRALGNRIMVISAAASVKDA